MVENGSPGKPGVSMGRRLWAFAAIALVYVLSCGPSYKWFVHGGADQYHWFQFYTPLSYAAHACQPVRSFLNGYMALWNSREGENWYYSMW